MKRAAVCLILLLLPLHAMAEDLKEFLDAATEANRPDVPLRADGMISVRSPDASMQDRIIIVLPTNGDVYLEMQRSGLRALLDATKKKVHVRLGKESDERTVRLEDTFPGTDFAWEDLLPFDVSSWDFPVIIDKSAHDITVQLTPKTDHYVLVVATFDRKKRVPVKTLYYVEKASNLVKMRTDDDFAEVAGQWLPGKITMKTFGLRTETVLTLQWRRATDLPEGLFRSGSLERESGLRFLDSKGAE